MRLAAHLALGLRAVVPARGNPLAADRLGPVIHQAPHAHEKPEAALEPGIAPFDFLLGRRHEHHIQPQRVGAVLADHVVGIDDVALPLGHDVAVLQHHALREQARERLVEVHQADVAQHAREEARIQQVQNRVLHAAAVEIDRHPVRRLHRVERRFLVHRIAEAEEVPRRIDERVHRVGFTPRRPAARGALDVDEFGHLGERRVAAACEGGHLRQRDWQLVVRHRHHAILVAIDHGNRRAPVPLARDAPVLEPILDLASANAAALGVRRHPADHCRRFLSAVRAGIDDAAVVARSFRHRIGRHQIGA